MVAPAGRAVDADRTGKGVMARIKAILGGIWRVLDAVRRQLECGIDCIGILLPIIADRRPERDTDQGCAAKARDDFRYMHHGLHIHDDRQDQDRIKGAVLQIAIFGKRSFLDQHDCHRAHVHGADAEADGDDEQVLRQREGTDHAIEGEAGVGRRLDDGVGAQQVDVMRRRRMIRQMRNRQTGFNKLNGMLRRCAGAGLAAFDRDRRTQIGEGRRRRAARTLKMHDDT